MRILQLLFLVLLFLGLRRLWRAALAQRPGAGSQQPRSGSGERPRKSESLDDLTQQNISDADYEELP